MALIQCENVAFAYEGNTVVQGLNFQVNEGDYLCIVGENGSGKSTLMKGLLRLLRPQQGSIVLGRGLRPSEIGYLPQQTPVQKDFPASVYEVVLSGRLNSRGIRPFYTKADRLAAEQNIVRLGLVGMRSKCYRELSGGQQQRVLLARALCATHKMLLLDEPVAGLDPVVTQGLYAEIDKINAEGITIVMISHDIQAALQHASHILHLQNQQVYFGPAGEYKAMATQMGFIGEE